MILTFQAIAIVLGVNWAMHPGWPSGVIFILSLVPLAWEERRPLSKDTEVEPAEPVEYNEDHPDWDL